MSRSDPHPDGSSEAYTLSTGASKLEKDATVRSPTKAAATVVVGALRAGNPRTGHVAVSPALVSTSAIPSTLAPKESRMTPLLATYTWTLSGAAASATGGNPRVFTTGGPARAMDPSGWRAMSSTTSLPDAMSAGSLNPTRSQARPGTGGATGGFPTGGPDGTAAIARERIWAPCPASTVRSMVRTTPNPDVPSSQVPTICRRGSALATTSRSAPPSS